jgi:hypothetical protein
MGTDILVKKALTVGISAPPRNIPLTAPRRRFFAGVEIAPLLQKLFLDPAAVGFSMGDIYPMKDRVRQHKQTIPFWTITHISRSQ